MSEELLEPKPEYLTGTAHRHQLQKLKNKTQ